MYKIHTAGSSHNELAIWPIGRITATSSLFCRPAK